MKTNHLHYGAAVCAAVALAFGSCVDHDYDLTEDIDLKVNVGGQLITLPESGTAEITLDNILDLDTENSSIKEVENDGDYGLAKGDYVILQDGNSEPADFTIDPVQITDHPSSTTQTVIPTFVNINDMKVTQHASASVNSINLTNDEVDKQLVRLDDARMNVLISFKLSYITTSGFNGTAYIESGYRCEFPEAWKIEPADAHAASFLRNVSDNVLEFTAAAPFSALNPLELNIRLTEVDFSKVEGADQGLYAPGHFALNSEVESFGDVSLESGHDFPLGASVDLTLVTTTEVSNATILQVTGVVNPEINVEETSFTISDIPDFLSDDRNNLEIENPQINFTVTNNSPLTLDVDGELTSMKGSETIKNVGVGAANGTNAIVVPPMATTTFVISAKPVANTNASNIIVPDLGSLISTVPDEILFHDVNVVARQIPVTFELGPTYTFNADYDAVIPLAFGEKMTLHYEHEDTGWDEDLEKYNFNTVEVTLNAVNSIPLDMTPKAVALRADASDPSGYSELTTVKAVVEGSVAPGSIAKPAVSPLTIRLTSTGENIDGLDGIRLVFDAASNAQVAGTNLNAAQALRFDNIKVKIIGGITVDLND